jgi:HPt (histidine-containing phosphotransfer) domain-containing protein
VSDVAAAMDTLRARFLARSKNDLDALQLWSSAGAAPDDDHHRILHRLAGAAGTFGFAAISDHAKAVEDLVVAGRNGEGADLDALIATLGQVTGGA